MRIAIVGAGPSGTALALELIRRKIEPRDIVLYDKATFPRPKLCGGGVTFRGTRKLLELLGERPSGGWNTKELEFRSRLGSYPVRERGEQWIYDRAELDTKLLARCRTAGVTIREATALTLLEPGHDGCTIGNERFRERHAWVVGADGANGFVRRALALGSGNTGRLVEAVFSKGDAEFDDSKLVFDFDPIFDGIPGYAWVFPYAAQGQPLRYKIGVMDGRGVASGEALRDWTRKYAAKRGFVMEDERVAGWPERYFDARVRASAGRVLLTGEAWGIDALLGEGIAPALYSSEYAADRLSDALARGDDRVRGYESGFLARPEGYNLWFQARLAMRLYGHGRYRWLRMLFDHAHLRRLGESGTEMYGRLSSRIPWLVGNFLLASMRAGLPSNRPA